ncbi:MAG: SynChlorMet cassette protein ScmC [Desulfomonilaceae bacterium]
MNELSPKLIHKDCFSLTLVNGLQWQLMALDESVAPWVNKLAAVLNLSVLHNNGSPKFMFVSEESSNYERSSLLSLTRLIDCAPDLSPSWKEQYLGIIRFLRHPDTHDVLCGVRGHRPWEVQIIQMWTALSPIFDAVQDSGGLLFHAALAELNGSGVLIVGPSGAGKSTCSRRLSVPWRSLCDDEVLVVRDDRGRYYAHPFPTWQELIHGNSDSSWDVQKYVQVEAIFFLNRSGIDEVTPVTPRKAALWIYKSIQQMRERHDFSLTKADERDLSLKLFGNACTLATIVPCFTLNVTPCGPFWEKMQNVLR